MVFDYTNYREYLRAELLARARKNPAFSMRSMARRIGISPGLLSQVLNGKKNLSHETAHLAAAALGLKGKEAEYFRALIDHSTVRRSEVKSAFVRRIIALSARRSAPRDVGLEHFRLISDWFHFPILMMFDLTGFEFDAQAVAGRLGITVHQVRDAVDRLVRLELLEKGADGTLRKTSDSYQTSAKTPNGALRAFHRQMLEKAIASLDTQTPKQKVVGSETMAFSETSLPDAAAIIEDCFQKLLACSESQKRRDHIYHLGIQFFQLTPSKPEKKKV